jgi:hypothetical protein
MKNYKFLIVLIFVLLLTGCADNVDYFKAAAMEPVGFWYGLWHGMTATFALIGHLFNDDIAVYAIYNNGGWYDFGFLIGVGAFSQGTLVNRNSRK